MINNLFGILVVVRMNVINCVILLSIWIMKIVSVEKELVDKLVEECTENVEEVKIAKYTLAENENKYKCSSIIFTIKIGIGTYFVYYKYMNCDKKKQKLMLNMILSIKQQFNELINGKHQRNKH